LSVGPTAPRAMPTVLVVDDEEAMVKGLRLTLEREGFRVLTAGDGTEALRLATAAPPDIVILDLMLPVLDGLEVCRRIRASADPALRRVPIIMLTARDDEVDKVVGLELGADDYVTKPFSSRELVARVRAALRRRELDAGCGDEPLVLGDLVIDPARRRVTVGGRPAGLTATEFDLLLHLARSPGRVFPRDQLLRAVWGYDFVGADRTVDVHVRRLREKIEPDPSRPVYVKTSWGRGYFFSDELPGAHEDPTGPRRGGGRP